MKLPDTDELTFRVIQNSDSVFVKDYLADTETTKFLPLERPYSEGEGDEWLNLRLNHWETHGFGTFILSRKKQTDPIGYCGLEYVKDTDFIDLRYGLIPGVWGHGYAYKAAFMVLTYGFTSLNLDRICGAAVPGNIPSIAVLEKLGLKPDAAFDAYGDAVNPYSISKEEFLKKIQILFEM